MFVSTVNAFVLRGAKPVFVDVRADTLNIDETRIEAAITDLQEVLKADDKAAIDAALEGLAMAVRPRQRERAGEPRRPSNDSLERRPGRARRDLDVHR